MTEFVSKSVASLVIVFSIVGGIFFGLFSCGGYLWHKQLFDLLLFGFLLCAFFIPPEKLRKVPIRIAFIVSIFVLFISVRAAASAFYPASPETFSDFIQSFIKGIIYGPC